MNELTVEEQDQLGVWLAENVMGWNSGIEADAKDVWYGDRAKMTYKTDWKPCEDYADAMTVLDKCADKQSILIMKHGGGYLVSFPMGDGWSAKIQGNAKTLPLAICIFAKKLFGAYL